LIEEKQQARLVAAAATSNIKLRNKGHCPTCSL
jgi:hypothetical protein